jgi:hypothetical protein
MEVLGGAGFNLNLPVFVHLAILCAKRGFKWALFTPFILAYSSISYFRASPNQTFKTCELLRPKNNKMAQTQMEEDSQLVTNYRTLRFRVYITYYVCIIIPKCSEAQLPDYHCSGGNPRVRRFSSYATHNDS